MSGTPAWASGGRKPESLDDNDTFAYRKHGNQGSVWDIFAAGQGLAGCQAVGQDRSYIFRSTPGRVNEKPDRAYRSGEPAARSGVWK